MRCAVAAALVLAACASSPPREDASPPTAGASCPTDEIAFTQAAGCLNDGSVELCLAVDDADALATVQAIAPTIRCAQGSRGRAQCEPASELLCMLPVHETECVAPHGAMTDAAWAEVCALAARPEVRRIVPTWFE